MDFAVLFPGQGTQAPGLGRPWLETEAWSVVEEAEEQLRRPLAPLLLDDDPTLVARTEGAQVAVFLASLLAWRAAASTLESPAAFAGHSLGQLTALVAAGALSVGDGAELVAARAAACQRATEVRPGTMAALLGATAEQADEAVAAAPDACWVANDNGAGQFVIAGTAEGVARATARAREVGVRRVIQIDVAGAFHTPLMQPAADEFATALASAPFAERHGPVVANDDGQPYTDGEGWRSRLVDHLVRPVRWARSMQTLADSGVRTLVEVGPGSTLAGLARRATPGLATRNISLPGDIEPAVSIR